MSGIDGLVTENRELKKKVDILKEAVLKRNDALGDVLKVCGGTCPEQCVMMLNTIKRREQTIRDIKDFVGDLVHKLKLYRKHYGSEYHGGKDYTQLVDEADRLIGEEYA